MKKNVGKIVEHIDELSNRLCCVENNLQYIKVIQALKMWLERFSDSLTSEEREHGEYSAIYESYFYTGCGFSFYDRVCNSILDYQYGNKPF